MKQNYKDMLLESASGYMMPFPLEEKDNIQATLAFGEQNHPLTGEKFFHKGIDFPASDKPLYAIATGVITGAGQDAVYDNYIVAKYGKYEVTLRNPGCCWSGNRKERTIPSYRGTF